LFCRKVFWKPSCNEVTFAKIDATKVPNNECRDGLNVTCKKMSLTFAKLLRKKTIFVEGKENILRESATICNTDKGYILMMTMEERLNICWLIGVSVS